MRSLRLLLTLLCTAFALPSAAQPIAEDEALVMRLIFQDCLGYVDHDKPPFQDLVQFPATPETLKLLPAQALAMDTARHLLSSRYLTVWGDDGTTRVCLIAPVIGSDQPMLLGVEAEGFLDRLTARAGEVGLTDYWSVPELSPLFIPMWVEPGVDEVNQRRLVITPMGEGPDGRLVDIGQIIVASGSGRVTLED